MEDLELAGGCPPPPPQLNDIWRGAWVVWLSCYCVYFSILFIIVIMRKKITGYHKFISLGSEKFLLIVAELPFTYFCLIELNLRMTFTFRICGLDHLRRTESLNKSALILDFVISWLPLNKDDVFLNSILPRVLFHLWTINKHWASFLDLTAMRNHYRLLTCSLSASVMNEKLDIKNYSTEPMAYKS